MLIRPSINRVIIKVAESAKEYKGIVLNETTGELHKIGTLIAVGPTDNVQLKELLDSMLNKLVLYKNDSDCMPVPGEAIEDTGLIVLNMYNILSGE